MCVVRAALDDIGQGVHVGVIRRSNTKPQGGRSIGTLRTTNGDGCRLKESSPHVVARPCVTLMFVVDPATWRRPNDILPELSWSVLERSYPHYPKFQDIKIGGEQWHCLMDIAPYVQIGPHCINGKLV